MLVRERKRLESILQSLERGQRYLMDSELLLCRRRRVATTTLDFVNKQGVVCAEVTKEIGSDLCCLLTGIRDLERFLAPETVEVESCE